MAHEIQTIIGANRLGDHPWYCRRALRRSRSRAISILGLWTDFSSVQAMIALNLRLIQVGTYDGRGSTSWDN